MLNGCQCITQINKPLFTILLISPNKISCSILKHLSVYMYSECDFDDSDGGGGSGGDSDGGSDGHFDNGDNDDDDDDDDDDDVMLNVVSLC